MKKKKGELSDTLKEAIRRARNDEATKSHTFPAEKIVQKMEIKWYASEAQYNAFMELLAEKEKTLRRQEQTARTGRRSESHVRNIIRADKYRDRANLLETIREDIYNGNYDKF